jgi:hypothetical protein
MMFGVEMYIRHPFTFAGAKQLSSGVVEAAAFRGERGKGLD